ncbi:MAG TPA: hypothetical protein VHF22_04440, partial [Planctomycetota bacterium]|nr:hypothetical protein [Planctomycetota bacterium]
MRARRAARALALSLSVATALLAGAGCITLTRARAGSMPAAEAIASLRKGEPLGDVVARCGAPLEVYCHGGGLLLLYRERRYAFDRLQLDPSRGLSYAGL